jgi:hypothetical protein
MAGRKEATYSRQAERLYVRELKSARQIARLLPLGARTVQRWAQKGGWDQKRQGFKADPEELADRLRRALEKKLTALEAGEGLDDPKAFDAITKAAAAIKSLASGTYDLSAAGLQVMERFTGWLKEQEIEAGELQLIGARIRAWFRSLE